MIPLFGLIAFIILYFIAAFLYPGGSQADSSSVGFSWLHNYWCNLLNERAMNGKYNTARPFAMLGMYVLCFSLAVFWYQFSRIGNFNRSTQKIIQLSGIVSACTGIFIFTGYHDLVINVSGLLALLAFAGTFSGLYRMAWRKLFWFGLFNLVLIAINNFIYYSNDLLAFLPVVQKITFVCFLTWIGLINYQLYLLASQRGTKHEVHEG